MDADYPSQGLIRRGLRRLVTRRLVAAASVRLLPTVDAFVLRRSRGRWTLSGWLTGLPIVQLGTIGARSGQVRQSSVMAVPDPDDPAARLIAAANFGAERHPAWYYNVVADPNVTLDDRSQVTAYVAAELHGADRDRAFDHILRFNPGWTRFQTRAGRRGIPVVRLDPTIVGGPPSST